MIIHKFAWQIQIAVTGNALLQGCIGGEAFNIKLILMIDHKFVFNG